jgi:arylsulfatase A-like enzyme
MLSLRRFATLALLSCSPVSGAPALTNVLFIAVDDLRPEHGVFGGAAVTPRIDAFASTAAVFPRNYVQLAVCSPTRTSLLTGRYPDTTHITDLFKYFRSEGCNVTTLPQAFRDAGYLTVGAGKIFHPGHASGAGLYPDGGCPGCGGYNDPPSWDAYSIPSSGNTYPWNITYGLSSYSLPEEKYPDAIHPDGQTAAYIVAQLRALASAGTGQPFFFAPGFLKPHLPFIFPSRFLSLYENYTELAPDAAPVNAGPAPTLAFNGWGELKLYTDIMALIKQGNINVSSPQTAIMPPEKALELRRAYFAATSFNDNLVGQLLDALDETGLSANTTVVLWGDHGENQYASARTQTAAGVLTPLLPQAGCSAITTIGRSTQTTSRRPARPS